MVVQNSSNYKTFKGNLSKYRYHRIPLANLTSNQVAISVASSNLMEFRIGAGLNHNLGKSFISYNYGMKALANNYACVHEVGSDFCNWVSYGDGANVNLVDLSHADRYLKMMRSLRTPQDEFESLDKENMNYKSNLSKAQNILPFSRDGSLAGLQNSCTKDHEVQYLRIAPNLNQILTVNRLLPLSAFKDTFVGMDKNVVFGTDMFLRFNSQHANRIGFYTTNPSNPHIAADLTEVTSATGVANLYNVYLYLAVETNDALNSAVKNQMMGPGIQLTIPFQYAYRHSTQAGSTTSSVQLTLTRQFGRKLKRIVTAPFNGSIEKNAYTYDHSNVNASKVKTVRASLDSVPIQDYELNCFNPEESINPGGFSVPTATSAGDRSADDYREHRDALMGSAMPSYSEYQTNWVYQDLWGVSPFIRQGDQSVPDEMIDDGLVLDQQKVYALQFSNPYANDSTNNYGGSNGLIAYYTMVSFLRDVNISSSGLTWL